MILCDTTVVRGTSFSQWMQVSLSCPLQTTGVSYINIVIDRWWTKYGHVPFPHLQLMVG